MSAKEITIFFPESTLVASNLVGVAKKLHLEVDDIPPHLALNYQFSAKRGAGRSYLLIEFKQNDRILIQELCQWEHPKDEYKERLQCCCSSFTVYYRDENNAKEALSVLASDIKGIIPVSIVENGFGCLLKLEDVMSCLQQDPLWSWEKNEFPELPDVAISEWQ